MGGQDLPKITVALAGNPNVGKSTLFNALTGMRQHTGNWPGKTVSIAQGTCRYNGRWFSFIDLPGTYSLHGSTEDEQIAGDYIRGGESDCVAVVCDGCCLERSLILALQILELGRPTVVCVNLMDEARSRGITVDDKRLSQLLGVPVVTAAAGRKRGIRELLQALETVPENTGRRLECTDFVQEAQYITSVCVNTDEENQQGWRKVLDRFLVSRRHGIPVMLGLLCLILWITVWGANYPSQWLEQLFSLGYRAVTPLTQPLPSWLRGLLLDGIYATCARVISVMLPPMAIFFPLFTALEDMGYLPRMAFLMDRGMCCCGGCGKQALTMCMGLGCNAVGVMGCRIIDAPGQRLAAILTNAMIPCNGRFPALIVLGSLFFGTGAGGLLVAASVALGMVGAMVSTGVLNKTVLESYPSAFLMEMPPFRRPRLGKILVGSLVDKTLHVAGRTLKVAAPAGAVLWLLGNTGSLQILARWLEPAGLFLGMNGVILLAFLLSIPANELLIPIMLMTLGCAGSLTGAEGLQPALLLTGGITWQMALCAMVFCVFHWPCATTLLTIRRETGSTKKTAAAFALPTAVGMLLCVMLRLILG